MSSVPNNRQFQQLHQLHARVQETLKNWHKLSAHATPLGDFQIVQQHLNNDRINLRQATYQALQSGLQELALNNSRDVAILTKRFLESKTAYQVGNDLNITEPVVFRYQKRALEQLAKILTEEEAALRTAHQDSLTRHLPPPTYSQLFGIDERLEKLIARITTPGPPWIYAIEGIGGIGKTAFTDALTRRLLTAAPWHDVAWVTAKQQVLNAGGFIDEADIPPALSADAMLDVLAQQLLREGVKDGIGDALLSTDDKRNLLKTRLQAEPHLIVIDNLETITDAKALLAALRELAEPSKFLLTTRHSLFAENDVFHYAIPELNEATALQLVRFEAQQRNLTDLVEANDAELQPIYDTVGGNPLALRLVVGQTHVHALGTVLTDLEQACGEKAENLYTYIYWQAWHNLDEIAQRALLAMPLVTEAGGDLDLLAATTLLNEADLRHALDKLVTYNLVNSHGNLQERYYSIHSLTSSFLLKQVSRWTGKMEEEYDD